MKDLIKLALAQQLYMDTENIEDEIEVSGWDDCTLEVEGDKYLVLTEVKDATFYIFRINQEKMMSNKSTYHPENILGSPIGVPNLLTKQEKEYYVSYNNYDTDESMCGSDTTALHINQTSQFLILNGNHTKQYNNCFQLTDYIKHFYANIKQANDKSEHGKLFKCGGVKAEYVKGGC